jgi:hypothetical protein
MSCFTYQVIFFSCALPFNCPWWRCVLHGKRMCTSSHTFFFLFFLQFTVLCTSENLTCVLHVVTMCTFEMDRVYLHESLRVLPVFCGWFSYFSVIWRGTLNFRNWTVVLPDINMCTSRSSICVFLSRWFYYFSSTSRELCTSRNRIFILPVVTACTSRYPISILLYMWFHGFLELHMNSALSGTEYSYFPSSTFILPALICVYFSVDDFIIFLAPHINLHFRKLIICACLCQRVYFSG